MGTMEMVRIIEVSSEPPTLRLETSWFPGQQPQCHIVPITLAELEQFQSAFLARPFGSSPHVSSIESISESGSTYKCDIRIASAGSRRRIRFEISAETHAAILTVFDSNIISEGFVRA